VPRTRRQANRLCPVGAVRREPRHLAVPAQSALRRLPPGLHDRMAELDLVASP